MERARGLGSRAFLRPALARTVNYHFLFVGFVL